jgi:FixJ family two-component response regulator
MTKVEPTIYIVDDDESVRDALRNLLDAVGMRAVLYGSTQEFLDARRPDVPSCLILDVRLPGMNGLELQEELNKTGVPVPIVFITAHGDIPMTSRAIKAGAVEFLTKPFEKKDLLAAVGQALDRDRERRAAQARLSALRGRYKSLTPREREVLWEVVSGKTNKEIANLFGLSEITVKIHRGRAMEKMEADSLADLVRMTEKLQQRFRK